MTKEEIRTKEKQLLGMTDSFCSQKLDDDYRELCEKLIRKLGRKRQVPFTTGQLSIWAAAVVYAIGSINFLFDKSFEPYVTADDISEFFGAKKTTVSNKAKQIKDMFGMRRLSSEFSTRYMQDHNPMNEYVLVDGFITPLSMLSEDLQEAVKKARSKGKDIEFTMS
jgi:hypothetical protein